MILVIDDDPIDRELAIIAISVATQVKTVDSYEAACVYIHATGQRLECILIDMNLGPLCGIDVIPDLRAISVCPILVWSHQESIEMLGMIRTSGADGFIAKSAVYMHGSIPLFSLLQRQHASYEKWYYVNRSGSIEAFP